MSTHCYFCGNCLLSAEEVGQILNPADPLTPASAREEMSGVGLGEARGCPSDQVRAYVAGRLGPGKWGHT